jgi:hypothetical protein
MVSGFHQAVFLDYLTFNGPLRNFSDTNILPIPLPTLPTTEFPRLPRDLGRGRAYDAPEQAPLDSENLV